MHGSRGELLLGYDPQCAATVQILQLALASPPVTACHLYLFGEQEGMTAALGPFYYAIIPFCQL